MEKIKRRNTKSKEQSPNSLVSMKSNAEKIKDGENKATQESVEKYEGKHSINTVLIPRETLIIEESRFEKWNFGIQTVVAGIGLATIISFVYFSIQGHSDNIDSINIAKESMRRADSIFKVSDSIQRVKDSITFSLMGSSNKLTEQSLMLSKRGIEVAEKNAVLNEESIRLRNQPYITFDINFGEEKDRRIVKISFTNIGATPAFGFWADGVFTYRHSRRGTVSNFPIEWSPVIRTAKKMDIPAGKSWDDIKYPTNEVFFPPYFPGDIPRIQIRYKIGYTDFWNRLHTVDTVFNYESPTSN